MSLSTILVYLYLQIAIIKLKSLNLIPWLVCSVFNIHRAQGMSKQAMQARGNMLWFLWWLLYMCLITLKKLRYLIYLMSSIHVWINCVQILSRMIQNLELKKWLLLLSNCLKASKSGFVDMLTQVSQCYESHTHRVQSCFSGSNRIPLRVVKGPACMHGC